MALTPRRLALWLVLVSAAAGCSFERRSPDFACAAPSDCQDGRVCVDHFCVASGDGGAGADAAPFDAGGADALVCPAACTRCTDGVCVIDCNGDSACGAQVVCPAGMPCAVSCGRSACGNGVNCSGATDCRIACNQASACGGALICGSGRCDLSCGGQSACGGGIDCSSSCACETQCTGAGTCPLPSTCPGPAACRDGNGCTSAPGACQGC